MRLIILRLLFIVETWNWWGRHRSRRWHLWYIQLWPVGILRGRVGARCHRRCEPTDRNGETIGTEWNNRRHDPSKEVKTVLKKKTTTATPNDGEEKKL